MTEITAIIGLGLIGGSVARALKKADASCHIIGLDKDTDALNLMQEEDVIEQGYTDLAAMPMDSVTTLIIATPPHHWQTIAQTLREKETAHLHLMMDVGSIKAYANECFGGFPSFIAAHPIAGSQFSGAAFSTEDLFRNKKVILCPQTDSLEESLAMAIRFWRKIGAVPSQLDDQSHDAIYAYVSHLPQFVAYAIARATLPHVKPDDTYLAFMRLSGSSPELWLGIFRHNPYLAEAAELFLRMIGHMIAELRSGELQGAVPLQFSIGLTLIPRILASCLVSSVTLQEKKMDRKLSPYAGSGFADMAHPAMTPPEDDLALISEHTDTVIALLEMVEQHLRQLLIHYKKGEWEMLLTCLQEAQSAYLKHLN